MATEKKVRYSVKSEDGRFIVCEDNTAFFFPPLYQHRYIKVKQIIENFSHGKFKKIVDIGSSELQFFIYLKTIPGVEEIVLVDKNECVLKENCRKVDPLLAEQLIRRKTPLSVRLICGDGRYHSQVMLGADAITMIELIEHMQEKELPSLVETVFGVVQPQLVVVTTPNADFNVYLPLKHGSFRHHDHKFEWSSHEFCAWCRGIVAKFLKYKVEFTGCGLGPDGIYSTQVAIFSVSSSCDQTASSQNIGTLTDTVGVELGSLNIQNKEASVEQRHLVTVPTVVHEVDYPIDSRSDEEEEYDRLSADILELRSWLVRCSMSSEEEVCSCQKSKNISGYIQSGVSQLENQNDNECLSGSDEYNFNCDLSDDMEDQLSDRDSIKSAPDSVKDIGDFMCRISCKNIFKEIALEESQICEEFGDGDKIQPPKLIEHEEILQSSSETASMVGPAGAWWELGGAVALESGCDPNAVLHMKVKRTCSEDFNQLSDIDRGTFYIVDDEKVYFPLAAFITWGNVSSEELARGVLGDSGIHSQPFRQQEIYSLVLWPQDGGEDDDDDGDDCNGHLSLDDEGYIGNHELDNSLLNSHDDTNEQWD